jgi:glutathione S-transferase
VIVYELYIANQNYSSWSLRPWVLLRELGIEFAEHLIRFGDAPRWDAFRKISPSGKVPCLVDGKSAVWDSLAITEYLAERHGEVWPRDPGARAWARSAAAEMHSGFAELRNRCSMSCGVRARLKERPPALERDLERLQALFDDGLARFGGTFLAGARFSAVDAFFAPVAFRVQTYGLQLGAAAAAYLERLLSLPSMKAWYAAGIQERFRDLPHDHEIAQLATVTQDLRAR